MRKKKKKHSRIWQFLNSRTQVTICYYSLLYLSCSSSQCVKWEKWTLFHERDKIHLTPFFSAPTNLYKILSCIFIFIARQSYTPFNHDYSFVSYHYKAKPKFLVKASGPRAQVAPTFLFFFPFSYPSFPVADNNILIIMFTWNLRVFVDFCGFTPGKYFSVVNGWFKEAARSLVREGFHIGVVIDCSLRSKCIWCADEMNRSVVVLYFHQPCHDGDEYIFSGDLLMRRWSFRNEISISRVI